MLFYESNNCFITDKKYTQHEELRRKEIFRSNLKAIEMHNYLNDRGIKTFRMGINEYADMVSDDQGKL